jgi:hypothetical protein
MSGKRRLAIFLTVLWLAGWLILFMLDGDIKWDGFFMFAVSPAVFVWGVWWVWAGFKRASDDPTSSS